MQITSYNALLQQETLHKDSVYRMLEQDVIKRKESVEKSSRYVESGAYEDQEAFSAHGELSEARGKLSEAERRLIALFRKPYFAHIEVEYEEKEKEHFYLSQCEALNEAMPVEIEGSSGLLIPFKQDKNRPISEALFHCYQAKNGTPVSYKVKAKSVTFTPQFICDVDIENRKVLQAVQFFPEADYTLMDADELLDRRLRENRDNPSLSNIIATLQRKQFEIIGTDAATSFVVQGCAGSGKSQCLLHRLFYLRDELSQEGWEHILLVTPTQLYRNYSADLIRRYRLTNINNCSIADLYLTLLSAYDDRFRNRHYQFDLSEEYLPDDYLQIVYTEDTIRGVEQKIESAIQKYVYDACEALGRDSISDINIETVAELIRNIDKEIISFEARERVLAADKEYEEKRAEYGRLQKQIDELQKKTNRLLKEQAKYERDRDALVEHLNQVREAEHDLSEWAQEREQKITRSKKALDEVAKAFSGDYAPELPAKYARLFYEVEEMTIGDEYRADEEFSQLLKNEVEQTRNQLLKFVGKHNPDRLRSQVQKRLEEISEQIRTSSLELEEAEREAEECMNLLRERAGRVEGEKSKITLQRSALDRSRYFLSRIESSIFEREVWNHLLPIKEQHDVKALEVTPVEDGRRETRILYKADLLFYMMIYAKLHPNAKLPDYRLFCIDEGQDLHKADYDMLHNLYPKAVFNIFGDTEQVLHTACGIKAWKEETGIPTVYSLNRNYRNAAAITEFCNKKFGSDMEAIGKVYMEESPRILTDAKDLQKEVIRDGAVVIVKDRAHYELLCNACGLSSESFEFLDTRAERTNGMKNTCYTVFAAKGLEFSNVVVYAVGMTKNQKVVACTRAMGRLAYYE